MKNRTRFFFLFGGKYCWCFGGLYSQTLFDVVFILLKLSKIWIFLNEYKFPIFPSIQIIKLASFIHLWTQPFSCLKVTDLNKILQKPPPTVISFYFLFAWIKMLLKSFNYWQIMLEWHAHFVCLLQAWRKYFPRCSFKLTDTEF